jgi:hypothetical protein
MAGCYFVHEISAKISQSNFEKSLACDPTSCVKLYVRGDNNMEKHRAIPQSYMTVGEVAKR